ncbi:hypothetical protein [Nocardioides sp. T2.26MG-1]|uniref:hypothetical protein n=1 Tax=Nocardioides sp. T2.26MG-1 TaxID=3041166 RepID=UPI0024772FB6|nr:hypothetical protein [Nocardioides sp. T2.26MG-1]CAI9410304.1 hypothetical protein HIDPHFAB_04900 [Nocardioides sp. T2.26MG-1]
MRLATATRLIGLVAVASMLAGCSASDDPGQRPAGSATPHPTSVVQPTQDPAAARLAALARLAEQAAAELPRVRVARPRTGEVLGADISWPQCPRGLGIPERRTLGLPMPPASAEYVVLGLTNGPGLTANPCLSDQVRWVRERRLMAAAYAVASYPDAAALAEHGGVGPHDGATRLGALANAGYQQALVNVATMRRAGLASPIVWVDVEPVRDFEWSGDRVANAAVVEGAVRGYRDAGYRVGVYSTPALWAGVVGELTLGLPEWRAAGQTSRSEARERCGADWSIQGGAAVLAQWVADRRDLDLTCPGTSARLGRWFQQY